MRKKAFNELRECLLRAGVAPRHVRRYLAELADHFADLKSEEERAGLNPPEAESAALARLGSMDDLARAMINQRQLKSWCARSPWVMFGFAPLIFLAGAYFAACLYLWCGWMIFKPGADTPFGGSAGTMYSFSNIYFQLGKYYYISAPVFVGWAIALLAARQRLKAMWPAFALILVAWMGATARISAGRTAVPHGLGHIRMSFFTFPSSTPDISGELVRALMILTFTALPYVIWRLQRTVSA